MPIVKFVKNSHQSKTALQKSIDYVTQAKKTLAENGVRYVSGINCNGLNAYNEMMLTRSAYPFKGTNSSERFFYQYIQCFDSHDNISANEVHAIALEFAEKAWKNHEVVVATHIDRGHLHSHFIISPVNLETGKRLRQSPQTLYHLRKLSDEICQQHGVNVLEPYSYDKPTGMSQGEYRAAEKGESWKFELMYAIDTAMKSCGNKHEFFEKMKKFGYQVKWTSNRKYITYACPNGKMCRDIRLHELKYRKEEMEYEFKIRRAEKEKLRQYSADGESSKYDNSRYGQMDSADKYGQESERTVGNESSGSDDNGNGAKPERNEGSSRESDKQSRKDTDYSVTIYGGQYCRADGSIITTGWETEREIYFADGQSEEYGYGYEEETTADVNWNTNSRPSVISDSLYFIGNLFEMIDNQKKKPNRKHGRLSRKEIEKRIAHGQKIDNDGWEQSM